ncbi:phosphatase [bacterium]|nr:MAG: phosphatase [bacterium]
MDLPSFLEISPDLWTSGQPIPSDWPLLARNGVEVVINLAAPSSSNFDEDEMGRVLEAGMQFVAVPVVWTAPKLEDYTMFAAVLNACKGRRVLVHCALNMRVSSFVFLYRILELGESEVTARRDLEKIWSPDAIWTAFINQLLNQSRS